MLRLMSRTYQICKQTRLRVPEGSGNAHLSPVDIAIFGLKHSVFVKNTLWSYCIGALDCK